MAPSKHSARSTHSAPTTHRSGRGHLISLFAISLGACGDSRPATSPAEPPTVLSLIQREPRAIDVHVAGPRGLRALQVRLVYEKSDLRVTQVEAGKEAQRLDRLFFSALSKAEGSLTLGLSDTRQVSLPARGALFRVRFDPIRAGGATTSVRLEDIVASQEGGKPVDVTLEQAEGRLEVRLP
jgi:hypothetical protein